MRSEKPMREASQPAPSSRSFFLTERDIRIRKSRSGGLVQGVRGARDESSALEGSRSTRRFIAKRGFDIFFATAALVVFALPSAVIAVLLKFKERHAVIFRQKRAGLNKEPFQLLKFQTMVDGVPTRIGRVLRRTGLDELPQFVNVLKGDMSIVGPRALTQFDIERLGWGDAHHARRWMIMPGITGYAQLYGGQHRRTSWFWDRKYIETNSFFTDIGVIIASAFMNILGKKRVRQIIWPERSLE